MICDPEEIKLVYMRTDPMAWLCDGMYGRERENFVSMFIEMKTIDSARVALCSKLHSDRLLLVVSF